MKAMMCLLVLAAASMTAAAAEQPAPDQDSLQVLIAQQQALQTDLQDGGIEGLTARQNKLVGKAQDEFFTITKDKTKLDDLSIGEKIQMENALERINAEVKNTRMAADDQNVCWRERVSGSTMKKTRCGTKAEMREAREGARDYMERPKVCVPPGCGSAP